MIEEYYKNFSKLRGGSLKENTESDVFYIPGTKIFKFSSFIQQ